MDKWISESISQNLGNTFFNYIMLFFTFLGEWGAVIIATCLGFIIYYAVKEKKLNLYFSIGLLVFGLVWIFLDGGPNPISIKNIVRRVRPYHVIDGFEKMMTSMHYKLPSRYSFPSGHSYTAFFLATLLTLKYRKLGFVLYPIACLIVLSRIWLGAHYFTDTLVGSFIGALSAVGNYFLVKFIYKKLEEKGKSNKLCA